jgi:hypothetical protein
MTTDNIPVFIHSRNNRDLPPTNGQITRLNFDSKDRSKNAIKTLGMWLAFDFASVFIPIAHFVLVPSLFITAFVLAMDKTREKSRNAGGTGECPACHQNFVIEKSKWDERYTDTCDHCHDDVEIKTHQT